jgi:2,3-bisphosphoglycerate-independent phosphoglycerate mutase
VKIRVLIGWDKKTLRSFIGRETLEVLVAGMYIRSTYVANRTNSRHTGKHAVVGYFIGAIPLGKSIIGV